MGAETSPPTEIRSPDHLTRSESLYRLSYPNPSTNTDASLHIEFVTLCRTSRWLVTGLSTRMTAFYPGPVHMGIVVDSGNGTCLRHTLVLKFTFSVPCIIPQLL